MYEIVGSSKVNVIVELRNNSHILFKALTKFFIATNGNNFYEFISMDLLHEKLLSGNYLQSHLL